MPTRRRALVILFLLLVLAGASFVVALAAGSIPVTFHDLLAALFGGALDRADENTLAVEVIRGLRLPRCRTVRTLPAGGLNDAPLLLGRRRDFDGRQLRGTGGLCNGRAGHRQQGISDGTRRKPCSRMLAARSGQIRFCSGHRPPRFANSRACLRVANRFLVTTIERENSGQRDEAAFAVESLQLRAIPNFRFEAF